jgi:hypothetical protein
VYTLYLLSSRVLLLVCLYFICTCGYSFINTERLQFHLSCVSVLIRKLSRPYNQSVTQHFLMPVLFLSYNFLHLLVPLIFFQVAPFFLFIISLLLISSSTSPLYVSSLWIVNAISTNLTLLIHWRCLEPFLYSPISINCLWDFQRHKELMNLSCWPNQAITD